MWVLLGPSTAKHSVLSYTSALEAWEGACLISDIIDLPGLCFFQLLSVVLKWNFISYCRCIWIIHDAGFHEWLKVKADSENYIYFYFICFLRLETYQSSDNWLYWLFSPSDWKQHFFFFSSDWVHIVLCENYPAFLFLAHGWADFSVTGYIFPVLCCLSLSQPQTQFSLSLVLLHCVFDGLSSSCVVQRVHGNCSCLYKGQDTRSVNQWSRLAWDWEFPVQADRCVIVTWKHISVCLHLESLTAGETKLIDLKNTYKGMRKESKGRSPHLSQGRHPRSLKKGLGQNYLVFLE